MNAPALHSIERQVARRATTLNQAWSWAHAIRHMTLTRDLGPDRRALCELRWLDCEMTWICEDLEDAGAWPCEVDLPTSDETETAMTLCRQMLERLVRLSVTDCERPAALIDAQARAEACLIALAERPAEPGPLPLAAA